MSTVSGIGHNTVIEHAVFTIAFENVSAFFEQFLIEFRLAAYTIKSRRYVDFRHMGFYLPEFRFAREVSEVEKKDVSAAFREHVTELFQAYTMLEEKGIPREDARFVLPYCYRSNIYCTVNARELVHIIYSALYGRGKRFPELVHLGNQLLRQARHILPDVFDRVARLESGTEDKEAKLRALLGKRIPKAGSPGALTELTAFTPEPEKQVALAALITHTGGETDALLRLLEDDPDWMRGVIEIVKNDRRKRELEQVHFTFRINGLSLAGLTHLARHRIQSLMAPSFTESGKSKTYLVPESIASDPLVRERYHAIWQRNLSFFEQMEKTGVVAEDLVYLYLSGNLVDVSTTMNARELYHFLRLRTCNRAQWEIRAIAIDMLKQLRQIAPRLFANVGPACFMDGQCPEGKFSCGQIRSVKAFFDKDAAIWKP
jgi:thymidylate synthase (FAD)